MKTIIRKEDKEQLIDSIDFSERDYNKKDTNLSFDEFLNQIISDCEDSQGSLDDAIFIANDAYAQLKDKRTYDVCFNNSENSNSKGWHESLEYCKEYIRENNGTNNSYFADYKGGVVSIFCNETEEDVYTQVVK